MLSVVNPNSYSGLAAAALGGSLASIAQGISPADLVIFAVAVSAAAASYRTKRADVIRRTNADLEDRNQLLEHQVAVNTARIHVLEQQIADTPNLTQHALLLEKVLDEVQDIHTAVVPPRRD